MMTTTIHSNSTHRELLDLIEDTVRLVMVESTVDYEELISIGKGALHSAYRNFDRTKEGDFRRYAKLRIMRVILNKIPTA